MCCKLRKQSQHSQPQSETSGKSIWVKKLDWYFLLNTHTFKIQQSFPLTEPLCFILSDKKVIFSAQKKNVCCYGNCAYQCVWLKVCLTGIMAQTSFWSPILSHCSLVKSFSYFCASSPFFFSLPISVPDFLLARVQILQTRTRFATAHVI